MKGPSRLEMRLMVSNRRAAARFARTFGAEDLREKRCKDSRADAASGKAPGRSSSNGQKDREEEYRFAEDLEREARLAMARKTLGVAKGASVEQIRGAYREPARTHHADKVASLDPEVREYSEKRMKEIYVAYAELKREWNDRTTGEHARDEQPYEHKRRSQHEAQARYRLNCRLRRAVRLRPQVEDGEGQWREAGQKAGGGRPEQAAEGSEEGAGLLEGFRASSYTLQTSYRVRVNSNAT